MSHVFSVWLIGDVMGCYSLTLDWRREFENLISLKVWWSPKCTHTHLRAFVFMHEGGRECVWNTHYAISIQQLQKSLIQSVFVCVCERAREREKEGREREVRFDVYDVTISDILELMSRVYVWPKCDVISSLWNPLDPSRGVKNIECWKNNKKGDKRQQPTQCICLNVYFLVGKIELAKRDCFPFPRIIPS